MCHSIRCSNNLFNCVVNSCKYDVCFLDSTTHIVGLLFDLCTTGSIVVAFSLSFFIISMKVVGMAANIPLLIEKIVQNVKFTKESLGSPFAIQYKKRCNTYTFLTGEQVTILSQQIMHLDRFIFTDLSCGLTH